MLQPFKKIVISLFMLSLKIHLRCSAILEQGGEPKIDFGADNSLTSLDLSTLLEFELQHQTIPVLKTGALQNLPTFYKLKLVYNRIEQVQPRAFINTPNLSRISLEANSIQIIPEGIFNNTKINTLYLGNNSISRIAPKAFDDMAHLRTIQLNNNTLKFWNTRWFKNSPNVQFVLFQFNQIRALPAKAFWNIRRSSYIHLDFSHNQIDYIDSEAFDGLGTLEILHLEYNCIRNVDDVILSSSRKLDYVTLNNNQISCLADGFLNSLVKKVDLRIADNPPMSCDCLRKIKQWASIQSSFSDTANKAMEEIKRRCNEN